VCPRKSRYSPVISDNRNTDTQRQGTYNELITDLLLGRATCHHTLQLCGCCSISGFEIDPSIFLFCLFVSSNKWKKWKKNWRKKCNYSDLLLSFLAIFIWATWLSDRHMLSRSGIHVEIRLHKKGSEVLEKWSWPGHRGTLEMMAFLFRSSLGYFIYSTKICLCFLLIFHLQFSLFFWINHWVNQM